MNIYELLVLEAPLTHYRALSPASRKNPVIKNYVYGTDHDTSFKYMMFEIYC